MVDHQGRITTYYALCNNYSPMKDKPTGIVDQRIGETYECSKFEYDAVRDKKGLWADAIAKGERLCFVCKHYTGNLPSENDLSRLKSRFVIVRASHNSAMYLDQNSSLWFSANVKSATLFYTREDAMLMIHKLSINDFYEKNFPKLSKEAYENFRKEIFSHLKIEEIFIAE